MARSAVLDVKVLVDAAQASSQLNQVGDSAEGIGSKLAKLGGAAAAAGIVAFASKAVSAASDLEQAMGGVDAVFKSNAAQVHAWASDTTDSIRLPQAEFESLATIIGSQLKNAGVSMDELAPKTHQLIQLGADLGAQFGKSTAEGVEALSSALKGEMDPLQNFGVTITAASVSAEEYRLKMGEMAGASDDAIKTQATLNLIMAQSADAQGAAARESDSYAAKQDALNEQLTNMEAAVGGPLLGALGSFVDLLSGLAPVLTPLLVGIASLVGWVAQLPTPILAVAAGFALWKFTSISSQLAGFVTSIRNATTSAGGFKAALSGIGSSLAAGGILAGITYIATSFISSMKEMDDGAKVVQETVKTLGDELVRTGGQITPAFDEMHTSMIENSEGFKALLASGISYGDAMNFMTDQSKLGTGAIDAVNAAIGDMPPALMVQTLALIDAGKAAQQYADQKMDHIATEKAAAEASMSAADAAKVAAAEQLAAASDVEALGRAYDAYKTSVQEAAKHTELQTGLDEISSAADSAQRAMSYVNIEIDKLTGRSADVDQAALALQKLLLPPPPDTASKFADFTAGATDAVTALNNFDLKYIGGSAAGQDFMAQLYDIKGAYDVSNEAAFKAAQQTGDTASAVAALAASSKEGRASFIAWAAPMAAAGVDVEALANKLGILDLTELSPKFLEVITNDEAAQAALAQLDGIKIDPKTITVTADDLATPVVESAISYVDQVTGETRTIPLNADPKTATDVVNAIIADINSRNPNPIPLTSDASKANQTLNQTTSTMNSTTGTMGLAANSSSANSTVNSTVAGISSRDDGVLRVPANTAPARNAVNVLMSDISGMSSTVTVKINADAAGFYSVWNSLPSSKSITVNQVQGAVVAAPAPAGLAVVGMSAPSLSRSAKSGGGGGMPTMYHSAGGGTGGTVININGALDPDAVARQIQRILVGRDRRTGGVTVGAMRARVGSAL